MPPPNPILVNTADATMLDHVHDFGISLPNVGETTGGDRAFDNSYPPTRSEEFGSLRQTMNEGTDSFRQTMNRLEQTMNRFEQTRQALKELYALINYRQLDHPLSTLPSHGGRLTNVVVVARDNKKDPTQSQRL
jgi:hypothetical protein